MLPEWMDSDTIAMSSGRCSAETLVGDPNFAPLGDLNGRFMTPPRCVLVPAVPELPTPNPAPSFSKPRRPDLNLSSPFYSQYSSPYRHPPSSTGEQMTHSQDHERSFWPRVLQPRTSRTRAARLPSPALIPCRTRSGSTSTESSYASSSRTKPAPAKSIMCRSSSVSTKHSTAKSVKFVEMPTVYYDQEWCETPQVGPSAGPAATSRFRALKRFMRRSSKAPAARPAISGPYPLWTAPYPVDRGREGSICSTDSISKFHNRGKLRTVLGRVTCTMP